MPSKSATQRARQDKREGKSPSTQAGEFVREEIEHVREGKHGARSSKQAIAIGLSKARQAGVDIPDKSKAATALVVGAPNIMAFIRNAVLELVTVHHGHMPEIEILSPSSAKGIWAMEDILKWPEAAAVKTLHGYGHYHETYRKTADGWRIETSKLTRLRVDIT